MTEASVHQLVERALDTYDITITDEIAVEPTGPRTYEAAVPFEGELLFDDVFDDHGSLLYAKSDGELSLTGVRDGLLLLTVTLDQD